MHAGVAVEFEWFWDVFELASVNGTKFSAWFVSELRDYDLTRILESLAALAAIGFTIWRIWRHVVAKPSKQLISYLRDRNGEIESQSHGLVADISRYGARKQKPKNAHKKFMDVDGQVRKAVRQFQSGNSLKAQNILHELAEDLDEKKKFAKELRNLSRKEASVVRLLEGIMAFYQRNFSSAAGLFHKSLQLNPNQLDATKHLGLVELRLENYPTAVEYFEKLQKAPGLSGKWKAEAHRLLGYAYLRSNARKAAVDEIRVAVSVEESLGDLLSIARTQELLGDAHFSLGNWIEAEESYNTSRAKYLAIHRTKEGQNLNEKLSLIRTDTALSDKMIDLRDLILLQFQMSGTQRA